MNIREQLPLEQQFELRVFEDQVETLSRQEAIELLVKLREAMLYQTTSFRQVLHEMWDVGEDTDFILDLLAEG